MTTKLPLILLVAIAFSQPCCSGAPAAGRTTDDAGEDGGVVEDGGLPGPGSSDGPLSWADQRGQDPDRTAKPRSDGKPPTPADAGPSSKAKLNLTYSGCSPDFGGTLYVAQSGGVLGISSIKGGVLTSSFQFDLKGLTGSLSVSSKQRQQTGMVINLVINPTTYTNITFDPLVYTGQKSDPIKGTLVVKTYQPSQGIADLAFSAVTLEDVGASHGHCTISGTLQTTGLTY